MRTRAFTLVELLVVVSVIAILTGLLLPALGNARNAAQSAVCLSNIRQLQIASLMYSEEHRGQLIEPGLPEGGIGPREELSWVNTLRDYVDEGIDNISPGDESPHWSLEKGGQGVPVINTEDRFRASSYGVNDMVTSLLQIELEPGEDPGNLANRYFNRMQKINAPSRTIQFLMMAEFGAFAGADHVHPQEWDPSFSPGPEYQAFFASQQAAIGSFGGTPSGFEQVLDFYSGAERAAVLGNSADAGWETRSNYAFLDGHAETMTFSDVYESQDRNLFDPRLYR
jgi:prepilin-type N-terminal cleavage/methylation domain-containing protein/prepilin-type processing-associated H-X9-DG protein